MLKFDFKKIIHEHITAIVMAVIVGVIIIAPIIIFRFDPIYSGIDFFGTDGESSYIAQVHAVYNGDFSFGNVFLYEYEDQPYVKQPLPAIITAGLGKLFGLYVPNAITLAKFVFPFITFLLVYALCFVLTKRKGIALLGASFVLLSPGTTALLDPSSWSSIFSTGAFLGSDPQFLLYARPISPQVSNLIFFAHIFVLWLLLDRGNSFSLKKKYILGILASVLLGLSFYTYLFAFSLLFAMNGFLWIYFLIKKDFTKLKQLTLIIVGALLLGASYILNMLQVFSSPYYADLSVRVGQVATTEFILSRVWFGIVFIYLFFYRKLNSFGVFTITLLLAFFAVSNVQVIIGRTIPIPEHYYWYYLAPFTGFILMHIGYTYIEKKISSNYLKYSKIFFVLFFIVIGIMFQRWSYSYQKDNFIELSRYGNTMEWIKENTQKDDVIFSDVNFSELVVVYTPSNVYYSTYSGDALLPAKRLRDTYYLYMYLDGVSSDGAQEYFSIDENRAKFSNRVFSNYWRAKEGCYECYPKEMDEQFIAEYKEFASETFTKNLKKYRATYAVWDKKNNPEWNLNQYFGSPVFEDTDQEIIVYSILD